jgi:hypothetical protein
VCFEIAWYCVLGRSRCLLVGPWRTDTEGGASGQWGSGKEEECPVTRKQADEDILQHICLSEKDCEWTHPTLSFRANTPLSAADTNPSLGRTCRLLLREMGRVQLEAARADASRHAQAGGNEGGCADLLGISSRLSAQSEDGGGGVWTRGPAPLSKTVYSREEVSDVRLSYARALRLEARSSGWCGSGGPER